MSKKVKEKSNTMNKKNNEVKKKPKAEILTVTTGKNYDVVDISLPKNFFEQIITNEVELSEEFKFEKLNSLVHLYLNAIQYFSSFEPEKVKAYQNRLENLLTQKETLQNLCKMKSESVKSTKSSNQIRDRAKTKIIFESKGMKKEIKSKVNKVLSESTNIKEHKKNVKLLINSEFENQNKSWKEKLAKKKKGMGIRNSMRPVLRTSIKKSFYTPGPAIRDSLNIGNHKEDMSKFEISGKNVGYGDIDDSDNENENRSDNMDDDFLKIFKEKHKDESKKDSDEDSLINDNYNDDDFLMKIEEVDEELIKSSEKDIIKKLSEDKNINLVNNNDKEKQENQISIKGILTKKESPINENGDEKKEEKEEKGDEKKEEEKNVEKKEEKEEEKEKEKSNENKDEDKENKDEKKEENKEKKDEDKENKEEKIEDNNEKKDEEIEKEKEKSNEKKDENKEKKDEKIEENKDEIKEENKDGKKEENKNEKKEENKDEIKEDNKNEIKEENKDEIKENDKVGQKDAEKEEKKEDNKNEKQDTEKEENKEEKKDEKKPEEKEEKKAENNNKSNNDEQNEEENDTLAATNINENKESFDFEKTKPLERKKSIVDEDVTRKIELDEEIKNIIEEKMKMLDNLKEENDSGEDSNHPSSSDLPIITKNNNLKELPPIFQETMLAVEEKMKEYIIELNNHFYKEAFEEFSSKLKELYDSKYEKYIMVNNEYHSNITEKEYLLENEDNLNDEKKLEIQNIIDSLKEEQKDQIDKIVDEYNNNIILMINEYKLNSFKRNTSIQLLEEQLKLDIYTMINEAFY